MTVLVNVIDENDKKSGNLVETTFTLDDNTTSFTVELLENGNYMAEGKEWKVESTGGRKRRSSKKYKKGGNKHTMTMGGKRSKKSKKSGKKSKTRRH
jgi:hypothetical protein